MGLSDLLEPLTILRQSTRDLSQFVLALENLLFDRLQPLATVLQIGLGLLQLVSLLLQV